MGAILNISRRPVDATQQGLLEQFFKSSTFSTLREIVAAQCAVHQVEAGNWLLNPATAEDGNKADEHREQAIRINAALEMLDELAKGREKWFTATITCLPQDGR